MRSKFIKLTSSLLLAALAWGGTPLGLDWAANAQELSLPKHLFEFSSEEERAKMESWVKNKLSKLSLEEQVGQLIMPIVYPSADPKQIAAIESRMRRDGWGGILYQKGLLYDQAEMNRQLQQASKIPLLIALDGEWGLYMRLKDAPRYPRNMGLGKHPDNQLLYNYGREVARQCRLMGIHINFAPDVDVNINPLNPVIGTRSFGDDPKVVAEKSIAYALGLEDGHVLSVAKHFPGHGDTSEDSHKTLPTVSADKARMKRVELYPFAEYFKAGLGGVMTAHLRVPAYESDNLPSSLSPKICTKLLKDDMGFSGLVFTDGLEMKGVFGGKKINIGVAALRAGNDILLGPSKPDEMLRSIVEAVQAGELPKELIQEKCLKVLRYKYRLIIKPNDAPAAPASVKRMIWTREAERSLGDSWLASLTLSHRDSRLWRQIERGEIKRIALLEVGKELVGTAMLQSLSGSVKIDRYSWPQHAAAQKVLLDKLAAYPLVSAHIYTTKGVPVSQLSSLAGRCPLVVGYFTSPYKVATNASWHDKTKGVVIAYEPVQEAAEAMVSLVVGQRPLLSEKNSEASQSDREDPTAQMEGALSGDLPRAERKPETTITSPSWYLPRLRELDKLALQGIQEGIYPGCQIYVSHKGKTIYNKAFGTLTGEMKSSKVTTSTIYDLASITKAAATTPAVMQLVGSGKVKLEGRVSQYVREFADSQVGSIRVRDLLLHQSGLPAGMNFYTDLIAPDSYEGALIRYKPFDGGVRLVGNAWGNPSFSFEPTYLSTKKDEQHLRPFASGLYVSDSFRDRMIQRLAETSLREDKRYKYSDLNFFLLQLIIERVSAMPLDEFVAQNILNPIGANLYYNPVTQGVDPALIAPAQRDRFLRKQVVCGYVDDETAACLGGVGGNAGLFGSAEELAKICQLLLKQGVWEGKQILPKGMVRLFTSQTNDGRTRFLGFDRKRPQGTSPTAESASLSTYGHLGFTGTCFWIDPEQELIFIFLSNRTYPSRSNNKLSTLRRRPALHELVYEAIRL